MNLLWKGFAFWKIFVYFALANWKQFAIRIIPLWKHFEWLREYSRSHFVFIQGASERCCRMAHVLLGQFCCSLYIYEKAIVQIIIRADLVLIAPHRYSLRLHKAQRYCCTYCENSLILDTPTNTVGPRNALNYVLSPFRNYVLRHKTQQFPEYIFAIFLAFPTFAVLSIEKCRKFFQGAKRCLLAPWLFRAIFSWKIIAKTFGGYGKSP